MRIWTSPAVPRAPSVARRQLRAARRDDRVTVTAGGAERVEQLGRRPSYAYQLEAFAGHLRGGEPVPTDAGDAVATAELIDACYGAAGLPPRPRTRL